MAKQKQLKALLLHNVMAPYRLPVFEEINRQIDLHVYFCKAKTADRKWIHSQKRFSFKQAVLPDFKLGPFYVNPTLPWRLLRERYDVYLVGDFPEMAFATFVTIAAAKLRRKPVVLWSETIDHDVIYFQQLATSSLWRHRLIRRVLTTVMIGYRRMLLKLPNRFVALSQMAEQFLLSEGVAAAKIHEGIQVMPRELLARPDTPKAAGPYADKKVVLYLGYLNAMKGIDGLIRAFGRVADPDARLAIVGSGPVEQELRELAAGDSRVVFHGFTHDPLRTNLISWADVMVLPTLADCWGMVVNEALHFGTPVITTDVAGASELLRDNGGGLVVPPRNEDALAAALTGVLSDSRLQKRLAVQAERLSDRVTDSRIGAQPILEALQAAGGAK